MRCLTCEAVFAEAVGVDTALRFLLDPSETAPVNVCMLRANLRFVGPSYSSVAPSVRSAQVPTTASLVSSSCIAPPSTWFNI